MRNPENTVRMASTAIHRSSSGPGTPKWRDSVMEERSSPRSPQKPDQFAMGSSTSRMDSVTATALAAV